METASIFVRFVRELGIGVSMDASVGLYMMKKEIQFTINGIAEKNIGVSMDIGQAKNQRIGNMTYNKLTCLFGHHDYSDIRVPDKDGNYTHLCNICKRSGYYKYSDGCEVWTDYDEEGNCIHDKWDDGLEVWYVYDKQGYCIHEKYSSGLERWKSNYGHWTSIKPKNWKYEKQIQ